MLPAPDMVPHGDPSVAARSVWPVKSYVWWPWNSVPHGDPSAAARSVWPVKSYVWCPRNSGRLVPSGRSRVTYGVPGTLSNKVFARTLLRIWLAYELGSMRYGIMTAVKPRLEGNDGRLARAIQAQSPAC